MTDFGNNVSTFAYDNVNHHIATLRQDGFRSHYQYSPAGHLKRLRHHEGSTTLADFLYEVDARGNRTKATELLRTSGASMATTVIAHDDTDIEYSGTWSAVIGFQETTQIGATLRFEFLGNTNVELTMGEGDDHSIYDVYVNETLWQSYDGYASSSGERVIDIPLTNDGVNVLEVRNTMDVNSGSGGRKVRFKQLSVDSDVTMQTIDYTYDNLSRLLTANYDGGAVEYNYGYDLAGNLVNNNGTTRTFNSTNQMTNDGTNTLTYDNNGNLTSDGTNTHTWDRANRLLSVGNHSYIYDGNGARIQKTVSSVVTDYLLDVQPALTQVLRESDGTNTNHYIHSPRGIHAMNDGSNWSYMLQDGLGSVRAEIAQNVAVNGSQSYASYGEVFGASGSFASPYGFTGEQTDGNGQVYLRARYYNPSIGVFNALDPFEGVTQRPMSLNGYSWVEGNPIMNVDPTGMCVEKDFCMKNMPFQSMCICFDMCDPSTISDDERRAYGCETSPSVVFATATLSATNTPDVPVATPTLTPNDECQLKMMAVSVANEVGGAGADIATIVAHIHLNCLQDSRYGTTTMQSLIGDNQVSAGMLNGFSGSCPQLGNAVYDYYINPNNSGVGDIPKNITVAEQATRVAWSSNSDPTNGGFSFLVSDNSDYISENLDIRANALLEMVMPENQGCAKWWMRLHSSATDVNLNANPLIAERIESGNYVLL